MNEYTDTVIGTNDSVPIRLASAYDAEGNLCIVDWTTNILSDFPWMAFLKGASELTLSSSTDIIGARIEEELYYAPIVTSDALGFYMIDESAPIVHKDEALFHEWNKLPIALEWLYGSKPYMTTMDITPVMNDLHHALATEEATEEFKTYVDVHSYSTPRSSTSYGSYGLYFSDDMVQPHGSPTQVNVKLGLEQSRVKEVIGSTNVDDTITLDNHNSRILEIILQERIGDFLWSQSLYVTSDVYLRAINTTLSTLVGVSESRELDRMVEFTAEISIIYDMTHQLPIYAEKSILKAKRETPFSCLTSNVGLVSAPPVKLSTASLIVFDSVETKSLSTNYIMLDTEVVKIGPVVDSVMYVEYQISRE